MYNPIAAVQLLGYSIIIAEVVGLRSRYRTLVIDPKDNVVCDINWPRTPLQAAREGRHRALKNVGIDLYEVSLWGSRPGTSDDCNTCIEFETLAEARSCFDEPKRYLRGDLSRTVYFALTRNYQLNNREYADELAVRENPEFRPSRRDDDCNWRREIAHQAGMGMGIGAYNDEMGY